MSRSPLAAAGPAPYAVVSRLDYPTRFESIYSPELVGGPVTFTDYLLVASNTR